MARRAAASAAFAAGFATVLGLSACDSDATGSLPRDLGVGTWGGENAGLIVTGTTAHVHVGCTNGDFPAPISLDDEGRFSVAGEYLLHAFPVATGPTMPARLAGVLEGRDLVMTVAVDDTVANELVVLGPVRVRLGQEPRLGPCPICAM